MFPFVALCDSLEFECLKSKGAKQSATWKV
jgi:hypothetical protein